DLLRRNDHCEIRYAKVCRKTGEEVPYGDIVKGYEYQEGDFVVLEKEDFEKANVAQTNTIEIVQFIGEDEIDQKLLERPYYIEPEKKVKKAYALLREALKKSNKVGIAKFVIRTREHLGMIRPEGDMLVLIQMRFASEVRDQSEIDFPSKEKISEKE